MTSASRSSTNWWVRPPDPPAAFRRPGQISPFPRRPQQSLTPGQKRRRRLTRQKRQTLLCELRSVSRAYRPPHLEMTVITANERQAGDVITAVFNGGLLIMLLWKVFAYYLFNVGEISFVEKSGDGPLNGFPGNVRNVERERYCRDEKMRRSPRQSSGRWIRFGGGGGETEAQTANRKPTKRENERPSGSERVGERERRNEGGREESPCLRPVMAPRFTVGNDPALRRHSLHDAGSEIQRKRKATEVPVQREASTLNIENTHICALYTVQTKSLDTPSHSKSFLYFHDYENCRFTLKASKL